MIPRYTRPAMEKIWSARSRFEYLLAVEKAVALVEGDLGLIPKTAAAHIANKGQFDEKRIAEIEAEVKHDIIAFVTSIAESLGDDGRFVHYGLTSSDVLDTALGLQMQAATAELMKSLDRLSDALRQQILKNRHVLCAGRTHGMQAEPTSFGFKLLGHWAELSRHKRRVSQAAKGLARVKLSGAVGTFMSLGPDVEKAVALQLGLSVETVATQVVPRDRHAELFTTLAMLGGGLERLAIEIRHLQRTEVAEAEEPFTEGQKGSSAMPHKRNPIGSENVSGLARLLRSYALAALEDMALWHERDISHSSVERVIFPDAFILADYACHRMSEIVAGLRIYESHMKQNLDRSRGQILSSQVLLALVQKGWPRERAYKKVQTLSHGLDGDTHLSEMLLRDDELKNVLTKDEIGQIFNGRELFKKTDSIIDQVLKGERHD